MITQSLLQLCEEPSQAIDDKPVEKPFVDKPVKEPAQAIADKHDALTRQGGVTN